MAILARTPGALDAMLRGLPAGWTDAHEGGDTWSPFDVVGHLIHGERTGWIPRARDQSLRDLAALAVTDADLDRRGRHPELGTVTLRQLLATWVAHDLDHIVQISRAMARQYSDEVGAWRAYLRIISGEPG